MEITTERVNVINNLEPHVGRYFSNAWVKKNLLRMTDEEVIQLEKEIADEQEDGGIHSELEPAGRPRQPDPEEEMVRGNGANGANLLEPRSLALNLK